MPRSGKSGTPSAPRVEFANLRILVRDFAASWRFYRDVLGLEAGMGDENGPYGEFVWEGQARLALFDRSFMAQAVGRPEDAAERSTVGPFALILQTPSVDQAYLALRRRGAKFLQGPTDRREWRLRTVHLLDPDGNLVELYSNLPA